MREEYNGERAVPARRSHKKKKNNKGLYVIILVALLGVLAFSGVKIISYLGQQSQAEKLRDATINDFVIPIHSENTDDPNAGYEPNVSTNPVEPQPEQISVNFTAMREKYPDVIGYIYGANTGISYPIVQGTDNDFYLDHDLDGNSNNNGSIFMEYLCNSNFTSGNSIIYGHHMKSGLMFAALEKYKSQSFYDAHPYMYIYTPNGDYRLEFFAGCVVEGNDPIYSLDIDSASLSTYVSKSTFKSKIGTPKGNIVTLSTCDYTSGYSDPRYILLGQLVSLKETEKNG